VLLGALGALLLAGAVRAGEPTVILLSLDGTRADYPERTETPAFDRMEREGARGSLTPVFPSNTFPSHVSLATGTHPDRHGIVGNVFFEPGRGLYRMAADASWIEAEPLWIAAERQGVRSASFFWVGSETDWHGRGASYRITPFDGAAPESRKVDQIVAWLDLPEAERPRLVLSWWHGCDAPGHRRGPDHASITSALRAQDRELGRLLARLDARRAWDDTTLIVTSDHGMAAVSERIDAEARLRKRRIGARVIPGGGYAIVWLDDAERRAEAQAALADLPGVEVHASDALPPELRAAHPRRGGHLFLITAPPRFFSAAPGFAERVYYGAASLLGVRRGMHGYRPDRSDMKAIFFALGRGVPRGEALGELRAIDVAPTAARLLGIEPPAQSEGRALFRAPAGE
jgi:predicted AlkP superfamily pyrophosphatase or phosphodiesterase